MSTKTGVAPARKIASPVAVKVKGVVIISSVLSKYSWPFSLIAKALKERTNASVPDEAPMQCLTSRYFAILFSSSFIKHDERLVVPSKAYKRHCTVINGIVIEYIVLRDMFKKFYCFSPFV